MDGSQVICPLHGFAFEIEDGRCVDDPGCDVRVHATRVEGGRLQVRLT